MRKEKLFNFRFASDNFFSLLFALKFETLDKQRSRKHFSFFNILTSKASFSDCFLTMHLKKSHLVNKFHLKSLKPTCLQFHLKWRNSNFLVNTFLQSSVSSLTSCQ